MAIEKQHSIVLIFNEKEQSQRSEKELLDGKIFNYPKFLLILKFC